MKLFRILTSSQLDALTPEEREEYNTALAAFIEEFQNRHPDGMEFTAKVRNIRGANAFSDNGAIDAVLPADLKGALGTRFILPNKVLELFASNAGFMNVQHLAMTLSSFTVKGEVTGRVDLRVEGDEYKTRDGDVRTYTKTHFNVSFDEYIPSPGVSQYTLQAKTAAVAKGYEAMLFGQGGAQVANNPVVNPNVKADMPEPQEEAEDTDV